MNQTDEKLWPNIQPQEETSKEKNRADNLLTTKKANLQKNQKKQRQAFKNLEKVSEQARGEVESKRELQMERLRGKKDTA